MRDCIHPISRCYLLPSIIFGVIHGVYPHGYQDHACNAAPRIGVTRNILNRRIGEFNDSVSPEICLL